jgi:AcrR family transcriptional regulator
MTVRRRRGRELEQAILDTVRALLASHGYAGLTYEDVAAAAGTGKAVLYRRWPTKAEMVIAALADDSDGIAVSVPDTGSLAADLTALMRQVLDKIQSNDRATALNLLAALDPASAQAVRSLILSVGSDLLEPILTRARERGELGADAIPERARALPFDLLRHDVLLKGSMCTGDDVDAIVADCVVPLFVALSHGSNTLRSLDRRTR